MHVSVKIAFGRGVNLGKKEHSRRRIEKNGGRKGVSSGLLQFSEHIR